MEYSASLFLGAVLVTSPLVSLLPGGHPTISTHCASNQIGLYPQGLGMFRTNILADKYPEFYFPTD